MMKMMLRVPVGGLRVGGRTFCWACPRASFASSRTTLFHFIPRTAFLAASKLPEQLEEAITTTIKASKRRKQNFDSLWRPPSPLGIFINPPWGRYEYVLEPHNQMGLVHSKHLPLPCRPNFHTDISIILLYSNCDSSV